jgi:arginine:ornithine antiporter/lysine permease
MMAASSQNRGSLFALSAPVIDSMIGAGPFRFPQPSRSLQAPAARSSPGGSRWPSRFFPSLAERRPDLDTGAHARAAVRSGDHPDFLSAFVTA